MKNLFGQKLVLLAWVQAVAATAGSLYFSEVLHWRPCVLCWYQRILMYPLVLVIGTGLLRRDKNLPYYVLPLSLLGLFVALYHNLLQWGVLTEQCSLTGVSCTTKYAGWFGFVTIPLLSLTAFWVISFLMVRELKRLKSRPK